MPKQLIIAEKPSVARDIARVLGARSRGDGFYFNDRYVISWALGHLVALCDPGEMNPAWKKWRMEDLPMLPETLPTKVLPKTSGQFRTLKKLMAEKEIDSLICATDSGREGELIFRLIYREAGCQKPFSRLWVNSMTDEAIKEGFASLKAGAAYDNLYQSARCRSEADWLVGMNASRAFTLKYDVRLSVGRVQTPTLAILVRRRREIEQFVPVEYYEVNADYGDFTAQWYDPEGDTTRIGTQEQAQQIARKLRGQTAQITSVNTERKQTPAPQLYYLTALQRDANTYYGFSAAKTLQLAQSLYETHKVLTYPRTDSRYLPMDMRGKTRSAMARLGEPYRAFAAPVLASEQLPVLARVFNNEKVTDHHALIVTERALPAGATADERKLYDLVARRLIAAFYPAYQYDRTRVLAGCAGETLLSTGTTVAQQGWRALYQGIGKASREEKTLPSVQKGDTRPIVKASSTKKATKPPAAHTEASLLSAMENAGREIDDPTLKESMKDSGLGTPATRAAIIERLVEVGYVQRKGKSLQATDKGVHLIEVVPEQLSSPETTGKWERALVSISEGRMEPEKFMASIRRFTGFITEYTRTAAPDRQALKRKRGSIKTPICAARAARCAADALYRCRSPFPVKNGARAVL